MKGQYKATGRSQVGLFNSPSLDLRFLRLCYMPWSLCKRSHNLPRPKLGFWVFSLSHGFRD